MFLRMAPGLTAVSKVSVFKDQLSTVNEQRSTKMFGKDLRVPPFSFIVTVIMGIKPAGGYM